MNLQWLSKLFGKDDRFFDLLEAGAEEARTSARLLAHHLEALGRGGTGPELDEFVEARRKEKRIRQQTTEELSKTFVTPLEREDIEALSLALYRVPKAVEKIVERLSINPQRVPSAAFQRQTELLCVAADAVVYMVHQLRRNPDIERIREANDRLQQAEGEADKVMLGRLKELYHSSIDVRELVMMQELYEMVEQAVDRCRNAGNVVVQIVLKNA